MNRPIALSPALGALVDSQRTLAEARAAADRHPGDVHVAALLMQAQARIEQIKAGHSAHRGQM